MRRLIIAILLITLGCKDKYESRDISGVTIKIDKQINKGVQDKIFNDIEMQLTEGGELLDSNKMTELKFDSSFFSYLLSVKSRDSLDIDLLKGYGTSLSNDHLNKAPIHYYTDFTKEYYKHDITTIIFTDDYHLEDNKFKLSSQGMSLNQLDLMARLIYVYTKDIEFNEKLEADIKVGSTLYSIDFILNKDLKNVDKLREGFTKLDPSHLYLIIGTDALLIKFRDSLRNEVRNGMYFK